jgi:hypothetical protein
MRNFSLNLLISLLPMVLGACASVPSPAPAIQHTEAPAAGRASSARGEANADVSAIETQPSETDEMMESVRRSVRSAAEWLARSVDSWFGDKPFEDGGRVTDGRLRVSLLKRQDEGIDSSVRFNARFRLPNVEENTYLFFGRDNQREVITDRPDAFSRQERLLAESPEDRSFFAGLGVSPRDSIDFRLGVRGGLKPYAQARYRQPWKLGPGDVFEFRETLFWTIDDHFGSTTALSYEHAFSSTLAARWLSAATITQDSRKFEWVSSLGVYKSLSEQRLLSLEALLSGTQGSGVGVSDYGVQTKWEQPVYKDWLLGEILVGHFWPRKDAMSERGRAWAVGGSLKMRF